MKVCKCKKPVIKRGVCQICDSCLSCPDPDWLKKWWKKMGEEDV